jgi:predicted amidohydrolase
LIADPSGAWIGRHRKVHLFDIDIPGKMTFRESETLSAGQNYTVVETQFGLKIGVGICYDIRFPEYAMVCAQHYDVRLLAYPGAFNTVTGPLHWELLQRARAVGTSVCLSVYCLLWSIGCCFPLNYATLILSDRRQSSVCTDMFTST